MLPPMKRPIQLAFVLLCLLSQGNRFGSLHPFWDMLAHFKLLFCVLLGMGLGLVYLQRNRLLVRLGTLALMLSLLDVVPWYFKSSTWSQALIPPSLAQPVPHGHTRLKLVLANVLFGNRSVDALAKLIEQETPDLVVLQEANAEQLDLMQKYHEHLPYHFRARNLPYGLAVWSHYPIGAPKFMLLGSGELPALSGTLLMGSRNLDLITTHLTSPIRRPADERNRQLQALSEHLGKHPGMDLILGDFNVSMWSPHYRRLEAQSGFRNCRKGFGVLPTWPAALPAVARIPIDQCLVAPGWQIQDAHLGADIGSDHLPLVVTLTAG